MRGTDLVLMVSILLGCNWCFSHGSKGGRRRNSYSLVTNDMNELKTQYQAIAGEMNDLKKRLQKIEKGQCKRLMCPLGYVQTSNSCFRFVMGRENAENWMGARGKCEESGANLVTINSRKKESFIARYIKINFASRHPVDLYTGLIVTDAEARSPYTIDPRKTGSAWDSVRWTATKEAVFKRNVKPHAKWSPWEIEGEPEGPGSVPLSCVIVRWTPQKKKGLTWRYHVCWNVKLSYVCEIRMKRPKCNRRKSRKRPKRYVVMYQENEHDFEDEDEFSVGRSEDSEEDGDDDDDNGVLGEL